MGKLVCVPGGGLEFSGLWPDDGRWFMDRVVHRRLPPIRLPSTHAAQQFAPHAPGFTFDDVLHETIVLPTSWTGAPE